ncbi:MAG: hypothetical protein FWD68_19520 [Alphaproteobacteria bacterium]|nr:hypothetical protein [Alphaproteobacteria bacterium]
MEYYRKAAACFTDRNPGMLELYRDLINSLDPPIPEPPDPRLGADAHGRSLPVSSPDHVRLEQSQPFPVSLIFRVHGRPISHEFLCRCTRIEAFADSI